MRICYASWVRSKAISQVISSRFVRPAYHSESILQSPRFVSTGLGHSINLSKRNKKKNQLWRDSGHLHVLWQVSFGCWVTWSISSWQKYHKSVFLPNSERIEGIRFAESSGFNWLLRDRKWSSATHDSAGTLLILLSAWDRSRDSQKKLVQGHVEDMYGMQVRVLWFSTL